MAARLRLSVFAFVTSVAQALFAQPQPPAAPTASARPAVSAPAPSLAPAPAPAPPTAPETPSSDVKPLTKVDEKNRDASCAALVTELKKRPPSSRPSEKVEKDDLAELKKCLNTETATTTGASVATDLVRTIAQVVVDKVQRQGWVMLRDELKDAACPKDGRKPPKALYPNLCTVLDSTTIQDLVASPEVLLDAVAADLLGIALESARLNPLARDALNAVLSTDANAFASFGASVNALALKPAAGEPPDVLEKAQQAEAKAQQLFGNIASAYSLGPDVLLRRWQQILLKKARQQIQRSIDCDPRWTSPEQTLWVAGMCFVERPNKDALSTCELESWVEKCGDRKMPDADDSEASQAKSAKVLEFLTAMQQVLAKAPRGDATVRLVFAMARAELEESPSLDDQALAWLDAFEDTVLGLTSHDWVRTVSGATRTLSFVIDQSGECRPPGGSAVIDVEACDERRASELKLLTLVGAIGNYALTYKAEDGETAQADREKIMGELVDRMVSRTSKERGAKFSLGGSLGLLGGARTDFDAAQIAFPAQLGLGFGVQSYGRGEGGVHLMVTFLDLGQYVTIDNSNLEVDEPDIESAITLGLTFGGWVWNREVPLYIGAYGGVSPFVRAGDELTYQIGFATGFYAPLLDFN